MMETPVSPEFKERDIHPCFSCRLPDCNEESRHCNLKLAEQVYRNELRKNRQPSELMKRRYAIAYRERHAPNRREA
ncbi:hypothetical protein [Roseibium litorale]|uniref:Uncharacterized protein n=1 Tax=Roseibium litorale TaxID=2803841 RepID=A0ABR9CHF3_9HYPH|nr:hypothetical protein [Roseibium litorale]MBD8890178.1 hypothetical protein [Roseibium litorale]